MTKIESILGKEPVIAERLEAERVALRKESDEAVKFGSDHRDGFFRLIRRALNSN